MDLENGKGGKRIEHGGWKGGQIHSTELPHACRVQMDELGTKTKKRGAPQIWILPKNIIALRHTANGCTNSEQITQISLKGYST